MVTPRKLTLNLFGSFVAKFSDGSDLRIPGSKQRALLAMLAVAAQGTHTRVWLQDMLWGRSGPELGRASLRRALSDLRVIIGPAFDELFVVTNIDICLRPDRIAVVGDRRDGEFLQGLEIPEDGFTGWLREKRQLYEFGTSTGPRAAGPRISPVIAVVPFLSRARNAQEAHFSDLMALEITRALSRSRLIDVISHLSSRKFEQQVINLDAVRKALGIDYLVYGTVAVDGDGFRVDADLCDAGTGRIHWSREFRGRLGDVLRGGYEPVAEICTAIGQAILSASVELARGRPLPSVESHALLMSSITLMHRHVLSAFSSARVQLEELIRRAPAESILHSWLGKWYILSIAQGWSTDVAADTRKAADCTARALDMNPQCSFSLAIDGMIQNNAKRGFPIASSRFAEAIGIDPNSAIAWLLQARLNAYVGNGADAVRSADRALGLSPLDPHAYFFDSMAAMAHVVDGNHERGLELIGRSLSANPRHTSSLRVKAVALDKLGRTEEARGAVAQMLALEPGFTIDAYLANHPAADYPVGRDWAASLRRSGVPQQ